ncbi:MAG: hypothetical protein KGJ09_08445 [Candidatus Omnitrophica bacterium]|nr:hypothetical protein [Candidatus Omnitrophota bacterium]MDE2214916.1 hypothetical protein [Candidatus Omnitrophota bacterium]MDE2232349.1 hypothetical protein [Candidatus Omnitrophota bacterium]
MPKESAEEKLVRMMQKSSSVAAKPQSAPRKKFQFAFSIAALNICLFAGIVACLIVLGLELHAGISLLASPAQFPPELRGRSSLSETALPSAHSVDYYLQQINERDIFNPYAPKTEHPAAQGLAQQMSKYKLVGISWLDLPDTATVMIEDTDNNKTYFLKQGQQLEGVTVKTIYTDRVVFSHENEEITIKL